MNELLGHIACKKNMQMRFIIAVVAGTVCVSVCLFVTTVSPTKMAEPVETLFGIWSWVGSGNQVLGSDGSESLKSWEDEEVITLLRRILSLMVVECCVCSLCLQCFDTVGWAAGKASCL